MRFGRASDGIGQKQVYRVNQTLFHRQCRSRETVFSGSSHSVLHERDGSIRPKAMVYLLTS